MSTHNVCFYGELTKIILQLSSNTHFICSAGSGNKKFTISTHHSVEIYPIIINLGMIYEPQHDKTSKMAVRQRRLRSESSLCA